MSDSKISALTNYTNPDRTNDVLPIVNTSGQTTQKITINNMLGLTSVPVGLTDIQTLTSKTLTAPTLTSPIFSGTITGTYTLAGTPTFPASVVTLTGSQTLTNKILTSPTINAPTITNASITADAITGFSSANAGTIYGVPVSGGQIAISGLPTTIPTSKLSNPYKFSVYRNAAVNSTASPTLLTFDTKTFDTGSNYSISTGLFTAPVNGFYFFEASYVTNSGSNAAIGMQIFQNAVQVGGMSGTLTTGIQSNQSLAISKLIQLAANDTVSVKVNNGTGTLTILTGANTTWFEGFLVSAT